MSDMVETSIAADGGPARPAERPLLRTLRDLVSRFHAAMQARRLKMIERVRRLGLTHID
jgi:hypothetical protein